MIVKTNKAMDALLAGTPAPPDELIENDLRKLAPILEGEFVEVEGGIVWKSDEYMGWMRYHLRQMPDSPESIRLTWIEASVHDFDVRFHAEHEHEHDHVYSAQLGDAIVRRLAGRLKILFPDYAFRTSFELNLEGGGRDGTFRFHRVRPGESWFGDYVWEFERAAIMTVDV